MRTLSIAVSPGEAWAALREDNGVVELRVARSGGGARPGAFYLGRVVALEPELPAALVDIGEARPAFLSAEDALPRKGLAGLAEGEAVLVQVKKAARADKAVGVTLRALIEGEFLALRPGRGGVSLRGRAFDAAERQRLKAALARIARADEGFDVSEAALGASEEALIADVAAMRARWQSIERARERARPPARLEAEEGPVIELAAEFLAPPPDRIVIDERAAYAELRHWLLRHRPALVPRLAYRAGPSEAEEIAAEVERALAPRVALAGGGALVIESTAAATMIDVDSGGVPAFAVNLMAARTAAHQIRLRNLAGPTIIDFIAMPGRHERDRVRDALAAALRSDPAAPQLLGWTRLGHMELVRPRRRAALAEVLCEPAYAGGLVKTALTVALEALRAVARAAEAAPAVAPLLRVAPEVAAALAKGPARAAKDALEARLGRPVTLAPEPGRPRTAFDIGAV